MGASLLGRAPHCNGRREGRFAHKQVAKPLGIVPPSDRGPQAADAQFGSSMQRMGRLPGHFPPWLFRQAELYTNGPAGPASGRTAQQSSSSAQSAGSSQVSRACFVVGSHSSGNEHVPCPASSEKQHTSPEGRRGMPAGHRTACRLGLLAHAGRDRGDPERDRGRTEPEPSHPQRSNDRDEPQSPLARTADGDDSVADPVTEWKRGLPGTGRARARVRAIAVRHAERRDAAVALTRRAVAGVPLDGAAELTDRAVVPAVARHRHVARGREAIRGQHTLTDDE